MLTAGLLLSLHSDHANAAGVLSLLRDKPALTVGAVTDRWLPVAMEAEDDAACRELHDWIAALPGVAFVDVVHVSFESETGAPSGIPENSVGVKSQS